MLFLSCVSVSGVLFFVGVCVRDLLICLPSYLSSPFVLQIPRGPSQSPKICRSLYSPFYQFSVRVRDLMICLPFYLYSLFFASRSSGDQAKVWRSLSSPFYLFPSLFFSPDPPGTKPKFGDHCLHPFICSLPFFFSRSSGN